MTPFPSPSKLFRSPMRAVKIDTNQEELSPRQVMQSLGTGSMSPEGSITFSPSPKKLKHSESDRRKSSPAALADKASKMFLRRTSSFLRVADLDMNNTSCSTHHSDASEPHYHHPAVDPPPGVAHDPKEQWIALNDGDGSHAPIAPVAVERLADFGLTTSMNIGMWAPDSKTDKVMKKGHCPDWIKHTFKPGCVRLPASKTPEENEVLLWSGNFKHGLYGSDLPAIRAAGVVNMSAKALMELLVDSTRVKEYNKLSLGRKDMVTFDGDLETDGPFGRSITKVMKSENKPPLIRKTLVFVSILHAKELIDGSGYMIVTRAVHHPEDDGGSAIKSEILMGVNLIRKIEGEEDSRCVMINVNHIRSPMVPMMIAKRIGVSAAVGFLNDVRSLC